MLRDPLAVRFARATNGVRLHVPGRGWKPTSFRFRLLEAGHFAKMLASRPALASKYSRVVGFGFGFSIFYGFGFGFVIFLRPASPSVPASRNFVSAVQ